MDSDSNYNCVGNAIIIITQISISPLVLNRYYHTGVRIQSKARIPGYCIPFVPFPTLTIKSTPSSSHLHYSATPLSQLPKRAHSHCWAYYQASILSHNSYTASKARIPCFCFKLVPYRITHLGIYHSAHKTIL